MFYRCAREYIIPYKLMIHRKTITGMYITSSLIFLLREFMILLGISRRTGVRLNFTASSLAFLKKKTNN